MSRFGKAYIKPTESAMQCGGENCLVVIAINFFFVEVVTGIVWTLPQS